MKRAVALLEIGQRRARVGVAAVLVEDQRFEHERFRKEPLREERRMQREDVAQSLLVLALAEVRPAGFEERVEPLGCAAADAVVELRGPRVVAALVREPREL